MCHNLPQLRGADVEVFRGATIWELGARLAKGWIDVRGFRSVLLCVGTNNFDPKGWHGHIKPDVYVACVLMALTELITKVRSQNPGVVILVCSVIPRPKDHTVTCGILKAYNIALQKAAKLYGWGYVATWKSFARERPGNRALEPLKSLFTKKGLHLTEDGAKKLRDRLAQATSRCRTSSVARASATP